MRPESKSTNDLVTQVIRHGLEPYLESTRTIVALLDARGRFVESNAAFRAFGTHQPRPATVFELIVPSLTEYCESLFHAAHHDQSPARGPLEFRTVTGSSRFECLIVALERGGALLFAEPATADVDLLSVNDELESELRTARLALDTKTVELQAVIAQADELAHTDTLTFLPNRRMIISELQNQVTYAERYGTPLTVSMLDLDRFKSVNDDFGHAAGDKVLVMVAKELRDHIRKPDEIGRYGGDEMLVILPNSPASAASLQAARLCERVRSTSVPFAEKILRLTLSAGIAQFQAERDDWRSLLARADRALYEAKHAGGDQWVILEA